MINSKKLLMKQILLLVIHSEYSQYYTTNNKSRLKAINSKQSIVELSITPKQRCSGSWETSCYLHVHVITTEFSHFCFFWSFNPWTRRWKQETSCFHPAGLCHLVMIHQSHLGGLNWLTMGPSVASKKKNGVLINFWFHIFAACTFPIILKNCISVKSC